MTDNKTAKTPQPTSIVSVLNIEEFPEGTEINSYFLIISQY